jgi:hypothetical protein
MKKKKLVKKKLINKMIIIKMKSSKNNFSHLSIQYKLFRMYTSKEKKMIILCHPKIHFPIKYIFKKDTSKNTCNFFFDTACNFLKMCEWVKLLPNIITCFGLYTFYVNYPIMYKKYSPHQNSIG